MTELVTITADNIGRAIAITLRPGQDQFVAPVVQSLAEAWQIAMSEATYRASGVAAYIAEQGATVETMTYTSPALPAPVTVQRWSVYPSAGATVSDTTIRIPPTTAAD